VGISELKASYKENEEEEKKIVRFTPPPLNSLLRVKGELYQEL
jgi:hypothetical protein